MFDTLIRLPKLRAFNHVRPGRIWVSKNSDLKERITSLRAAHTCFLEILRKRSNGSLAAARLYVSRPDIFRGCSADTTCQPMWVAWRASLLQEQLSKSCHCCCAFHASAVFPLLGKKWFKVYKHDAQTCQILLFHAKTTKACWKWLQATLWAMSHGLFSSNSQLSCCGRNFSRTNAANMISHWVKFLHQTLMQLEQRTHKLTQGLMLLRAYPQVVKNAIWRAKAKKWIICLHFCGQHHV